MLGVHYFDEYLPSVLEQFTRKALSWVDSDALMIRYEDLLKAAMAPEDHDSTRYFEELFGFLGMALPGDWMARVTAGASTSISTTIPGNMTFERKLDRRDRLDAYESQLLHALAPGLARSLGYED
jgi:hypothetical protein